MENARRKLGPKHGGDRIRRDFSDVELAAPVNSERLLALDEALAQLTESDPKVAELLQQKQVLKTIVVPGRLVNFVIR